MLPRDELLKSVENREALAKILDRAEEALKTWEITQTDFLSPPELFEAQRLFETLTEVQIVAWGGLSSGGTATVGDRPLGFAPGCRAGAGGGSGSGGEFSL